MSRPIKPGPAPTWELPHGKGQGPQPGNHTLPPLKLAKKKSQYNNQSPPSANA